MTTLRIAPVRVGLIGYGYSGKTFHAPLIGSVAGLNLGLIGSHDAARVQADLPGMIVNPDPLAVATSDAVDLVVIATPNDSHAPLARAALQAGKHVVIDKPFTLDLTEARDLVALADRCGRVLSVFHNRRWDSDYLTVRAAIARGLIGDVRHFESHFDRFRPAVRDRWRERGGPGSGLWFDLGPHLVDQALCLFGLPERITGNLALLRDGACADDWAHVVFDYPQARVLLHASMLAARSGARFVVHGDRGSIVKQLADRQEQQLLDGMVPGADDWGRDPDPLIVYDGTGTERTVAASNGDQRLYYRGVLAAMSVDAARLISPLQAVGVMACIEAAAASAREHRAMGVTLTAKERAAWDSGRRP